MTRPRNHLLTSAPVAVVFQRRLGTPAALAVLAGGLFIDLDHLVDYVWTRVRDEKSHYLAPLHGWELAAAVTAGAVIAFRRVQRRPLPDSVIRPQTWLEKQMEQPVTGAVLAGLAAGMWLHLVQDTVTNRPRHPLVYSLLYRLRYGFTREITGWEIEDGFHEWSALPWYRWYQAL